jgi:predicted transcriptional regulator
MACVWAHDRPVTGRAVVDELAKTRRIAYTTVLTVMDRLADKGLLAKQPAGRVNAYRAVQSREAYTAGLMTSLLGGAEDPSAVLLCFAKQLRPEEAERLRSALDEGLGGRAGQRRA